MIRRAKRRGFVRTRISRTETTISCLLLLLLAGIGVAITVKGQNYDPGLFRLDIHTLAKQRAPANQQALSEDRSARVPPEYPADQEKGVSVPSPEAAPRKPAPAGLLDGLAPAGWKPLGEMEQFTAATLYEKIDGRAEQYLDYKFVRLSCVSLINEQDKNQFIDIYVFDMGRPAHAFGVYSGERSEGVPAAHLGREGYRAEASYFFWKGPYYVQVLASQKGTKLAEVGLTVGHTLEKRLKDDGEPLWGLTALPEKDRIPGTVQYFVTDAMSLDFLKDTYLAQYRKGEAKIMVFLSRQPSAEAAGKTMASYEAYLNGFGKIMGKQETDGYTLVTGDMRGAFDVVFRKGRLIGGVTMVESRPLAEKAALDLLAALHDRD